MAEPFVDVNLAGSDDKPEMPWVKKIKGKGKDKGKKDKGKGRGQGDKVP